MKTFSTLLAFLCLSLLSVTAAVKPGDTAPDFSLTDFNGKTHKLSDYKGKYVVLEWINHECPFVVGQYDPGLMPAAQKTAVGKDVIWLSINSTKKDHGNYKTPGQEKALYEQKGSAATAVLNDASGQTGKAYGAKTTPHMFVINPAGQIIYAGAIDNQDKKKPLNYVIQALEEAQAGKPVTASSTKPYGCGVKY